MSIFGEIVEEVLLLKEKEGFEVIHAKTILVDNFEANAEDLRELTAMTTDAKCPADVLTGLEISDELAVCWEHRTSPKVTGELILRSPLVFMVESRLDPALFDETFDGINLSQTRTIDYAGYTGRGLHALLEIKDDKLIDEVLLFDLRRLYKMNIGYLEYVSLVRLTRGIEYWQLLYCDEVNRSDSRIEIVGRGLELLAKEFGKDDYSDLFARLERLRG